jgi:amino-acid N-acetyltransferase
MCGDEHIAIEPATDADSQAILDLVSRCGLPLDGLAQHLSTGVVARAGEPGAMRVVGNATLELYGQWALLRSVAVDEAVRGCGVGRRLTEAALDMAVRRGVHRVYLLTETAAGFFLRFGFRPITREEVPPPVRASVEFTSACPSSAAVMELAVLGPGR